MNVLIPDGAAIESEDEDSEAEDEPELNGMFLIEHNQNQYEKENRIVNKWFTGNEVNEKLAKQLKEEKDKAAEIVPDALEPIEYLDKFFDSEVYDLILAETIRYAHQLGDKKFKLEIGDLKTFIGILIVSSYCKVSRKRMYWQVNSDSHNEAIANAMARDTFHAIERYLHFCNNEHIDHQDKFFKIRSIVNLLNKKFLTNTCFNERCFDVDESMVPYFGHHPTKQSIRNKPVRFGFKIFCLNQPSGYLVNCDPYQGKGSGHHQFSDFGLSGGTVLYLISTLPVKGYIYMDNFFSTIKLFNELTRLGYGAIGTFRCNRLESIPRLDKKSSCGSYTCHSKENGSGDKVTVTQVLDNNIVSIGSNVIKSEPLKELNRYSKAEKQKVPIQFPGILSDYNTNMGGTDKLDQFLSNYRISIKRKKFYYSIFNWFVSASVYNSWILYKRVDKTNMTF